MVETLLITGATGFIGKNLVELEKQKRMYKVVAFVDENDASGISYLSNNHIDFLTLKDLDNFQGNVDYCIHLASYGVAYGARDVDKMIDVNIKLTMKVASFCAKHDCKLFINTGSCFEYGSKASGHAITEQEVLYPDDIYAASKVACEDFLRVYSKLICLKTVTIRPFSIFGKYEPNNRLVPLLFDSGMSHSNLDLTNGEQIRDYMDVLDVVDSIHSLIESNTRITDNESINICTGNPMSLRDFIKRIVYVCNFDPGIFRFGLKEYRENESMCFIGSNKRLLEIIGPKDYLVTDEKILRFYRWYKRQTR